MSNVPVELRRAIRSVYLLLPKMKDRLLLYDAEKAIRFASETSGTDSPDEMRKAFEDLDKVKGRHMANVIVELTREMRRVQLLYPSLSGGDLDRVQRIVHFAHVALTTNSYENMQESLDDLREVKAPVKKP